MTDEARAILSENILGTLATINEDGSPWATPLHFFFDDEAVYWLSNADKQHSVNISRDPRASVSVFSPDESKGPKGVYINGIAEVLKGSKIDYMKQLVAARIGKVPSALEDATAYRLQIGKFNSSKSVGNCWYFYT